MTAPFSFTRIAFSAVTVGLLFMASAVHGQSSSGELLIDNANLMDVEAQAVRHGALLIRDGKVVAELKKAPEHFKGRVIDAGQRFVIPGLIDMHTHAFGNRAPHAPSDSPGIEAISQRVLYAGVTGIVDLFGREEVLLAARANQRAGKFPGADIHASLTCLTAPEGHCTEYGITTRTIDSPEQARQEIGDLSVLKPDVIKIVYQPSDDQPSIDKATFASAVAASKEANIPTIVHIKTWQDIEDAIDVGATAVTHTPGGNMPEGLAERMNRSGLIVIPTLAVETELTDFVFGHDVLDNPLARKMTTDAIIAAYSSEKVQTQWSDRQSRWSMQDARKLASVGEMNSAGVTILAGTDAGNWGTVQGFSIHRELVKLTKAGLTNWEALSAATTKAAEFLGIEYGFRPGAQASFVILDASPIDNIANTQRIHSVIHHGRIVDREESLARSFPTKGD